MTPDQITQLRQLTQEIRFFLRSLQNHNTLVELAMENEAKTDKILALLLCPTCNGSGKLPWTHPAVKEQVLDVNNPAVDDEYPCPDCQPCKTCSGTKVVGWRDSARTIPIPCHVCQKNSP